MLRASANNARSYPLWYRVDGRTRLSELGVSPDVAERILGHVLGGIRRVYDRHDYVPQMRAALDLWGEEFDRLTSAALSLVE